MRSVYHGRPRRAAISPPGAGDGPRSRRLAEKGALHVALAQLAEQDPLINLRQVTDCTVTMTHTGYAPRQSHSHQGFDRSMSSTGADFRGLTPLVLIEALKRAGTRVCEPIHRFHLEIPADAFGATASALARLRAVPRTQEMRGSSYVLEGEIPASKIPELQQQLSALTRGEGVMGCAFSSYQPVRGTIPTRPRTDHNPLDRKAYLLNLARPI